LLSFSRIRMLGRGLPRTIRQTSAPPTVPFWLTILLILLLLLGKRFTCYNVIYPTYVCTHIHPGNRINSHIRYYYQRLGSVQYMSAMRLPFLRAGCSCCPLMSICQAPVYFVGLWIECPYMIYPLGTPW
jgi:hypothetical protein